MGKVTVNLNGRAYRLGCGDGEEERLRALASYLGKKIDQLASEYGQIGDERLTVMAALLVTDELFDARERGATAPTDDPIEAAAERSGDQAAAAVDDGPDCEPTGISDDRLTEAEPHKDGEPRPEPLLKRALRRSQARAAHTPLSLEQRLAAAREGGSTDQKSGGA